MLLFCCIFVFAIQHNRAKYNIIQHCKYLIFNIVVYVVYVVWVFSFLEFHFFIICVYQYNFLYIQLFHTSHGYFVFL